MAIDRCKYCGAKLAEEYRGVYAFECGSEHYAEDGNWAQMRACCEREAAKKEPPAECQWCGSGAWHDRPSVKHYTCGSSWRGGAEWKLSRKCMARCAEQLLKIRKGKR
jgi:hypothetical protein